MYNIPNRRMYYYMEVPTWDGNRKGADIYKIPQPIPADFKYTVIIVCNRMRELNTMNKQVLTTFASRQAYQNIKGHYIPIINDAMSDESVLDLEKRKYYIQKYDFTMMGFLIDEQEFEVYPALSRTFQMYEVDQRPTKRPKKKLQPPQNEVIILNYVEGVTSQEHFFEYTCDLMFENTDNISSYSVYINENYYGDDVDKIQINTNDLLRIDIIKENNSNSSTISFVQFLV